MFTNRTLIIVLGITVLFLSLLLIIVNSSIKKQKLSPTNKSTVSLTKTPTPLPTDLAKPTFTGALEEDIPKSVENAVEQKRTLRKSLPVKTDSFEITFDWDRFKFIVKLQGDKQNAKQEFSQWLKQNYPNIEEKEFLFK